MNRKKIYHWIEVTMHLIDSIILWAEIISPLAPRYHLTYNTSRSYYHPHFMGRFPTAESKVLIRFPWIWSLITHWSLLLPISPIHSTHSVPPNIPASDPLHLLLRPGTLFLPISLGLFYHFLQAKVTSLTKTAHFLLLYSSQNLSTPNPIN